MMRTVLLFVSSAAGLYIAAYFTLVYYEVIPHDAKYLPRFCRIDESMCKLVLRHPDSRVFGIPNSVLGVGYYALILIFVFAWQLHPLEEYLMYLSWITIILAFYLIYSLFYRVNILCPMCMIVHGINILIAVVLTFQ